MGGFCCALGEGAGVPGRCRGGACGMFEDTDLVRIWYGFGVDLVRVWSFVLEGFGWRLGGRGWFYTLSLHIYGTETAFCQPLWGIWEGVSPEISGRYKNYLPSSATGNWVKWGDFLSRRPRSRAAQPFIPLVLILYPSEPYFFSCATNPGWSVPWEG